MNVGCLTGTQRHGGCPAPTREVMLHCYAGASPQANPLALVMVVRLAQAHHLRS